MKKLLLLLLLIGLTAAAGFIGYKFVYPMFFATTPEQAIEQEPLTGDEPTPTEDNESIIIDEESPTIDSDEIITDQPITGTNTSKRKVPTLSEKKLFENTFARFAYPSSLEIQTKTMNSLEVFKDTERLGTIAIYNNAEGLDLESYLKKDNLVDYFTEGAKFNISPIDIELSTAQRAVLFKNFPGFVTADISVIQFEGLILVISDWSANDIIQEYIVPSIEKIN